MLSCLFAILSLMRRLFCTRFHGKPPVLLPFSPILPCAVIFLLILSSIDLSFFGQQRKHFYLFPLSLPSFVERRIFFAYSQKICTYLERQQYSCLLSNHYQLLEPPLLIFPPFRDAPDKFAPGTKQPSNAKRRKEET